MPDLKWSETDFVECLGVLPIYEEEYDVFTVFEIERKGLKLEINVWQHESLFSFSLFQTQAESPFITIRFVVRDKVRFINDKRGYYLEFSDCVIVDSRFYRIETQKLFDKEKYPEQLNIELTVDPQIKIDLK